MEKLRKFALSLLYHAKRIDITEISAYSNNSLKNLLEVAFEHPLYKDIFEFELAESLVCSHLEDIIPQSENRFSTNDADDLINNLYDGLKRNIAENWIVFPLRNAYLTETIRFKDFVFIGGNKEEKTDVLRRLGRTSMAKAKSRVEHTTRKSKHFFEHPLLAIRVRHQYNYVYNMARKFSFYANSILQALYWGRVYPKYEYPIFYSPFDVGNAYHILVYGKEDWRINHMAANFDTTCKINLDFLHEKSYRTLYTKIFHELFYNSHEKRITYKFTVGFKLFKEAIDLERNRNIYQGISISLLLMTIASENILLKQEDAKRNKLAVLYSRLVRLDDVSDIEIARLLKSVYSLRSEYVHAGTEIHKDFNPDLSDGVTTQKYELFRRVISHLLCDTVYYTRLVNRRSGIRGISEEEIWSEYLDNHWRRGKTILRR
ncbi:hypothetical protein [Terribacillus sp. JSM ZJ617]|uniref:hypothetical protein n=1 Tax=Terribacillus sp. JSM ZJ617 TaxID=3342119 RepID=UPI0035A85BE7